MTRRVVRLFVLLGVSVAVYLVLCLFDREARADTGSVIGDGVTKPVAEVKATAADAAKAVTQPRPPAPKADPQQVARPTTKTPKVHTPEVSVPKAQTVKVHLPKVGAPKVQAPKVPAPKANVPKTQASRVQASKAQAPQVQVLKVQVSKVQVTKVQVTKVQAPKIQVPEVQTPTVPVPEKDAASTLRALETINAPGVSALSAIEAPSGLVRETVRTVLVGASEIGLGATDAVRDAVGVAVAPVRTAVVQQQLLSSDLPRLPEVAPATWPQLPSLSQLPSTADLAGPPWADTTLPSASARASGLDQLLTSTPSGVTEPSAPVQPVSPRRPAEPSSSSGQARDSGGGPAPAMGTVPSSWRPEVTVAGRRLATDLIARGRTVRYAGPPS